MKGKRLWLAAWLGFFSLLIFAGCKSSDSGSGDSDDSVPTKEIPQSYSDSGFGAWDYTNSNSSNVDVEFSVNGLSSKQIYVVLSNSTSSAVTLSDGSGSGTALPSSAALFYQEEENSRQYENILPDYVLETREKPFPLTPMSEGPSYALSPAPPNYASINDTKNWKYDGNSNSVATTLRGQGALSGGKTLNVWVSNSMWTTGTENYRINQTRVDSVVSKFATDSNNIYSLTKNILGEEWGTHIYINLLAANQTEINIVFYDIGFDEAGSTLGFFWSINNFSAASSSETAHSNDALVFFMDAPTFGEMTGNTWEVSDKAPTIMLGTLAHEFQHMIHFYQKAILRGATSKTWLDEMSAQLTEDFLATYIGGNGTGPSQGDNSRLSNYVKTPNCDITSWSSTLFGECSVFDSYATAYAFGGYLIRNYGGASFLRSLVQSSTTGMDAVTYALAQEGSSDSASEAFRKWGVTLAMNPSKGILPTGYGYPELIDGSYTLQQADMYGFGSSYQPKIYTTPPATLKANSHVVWKYGSAQSGTGTAKVRVPAGISVTFVVEP